MDASLGLIQNAVLLMAIVLVFDQFSPQSALDAGKGSRRSWLRQIGFSLLLGGMGMLVMLLPWKLTPEIEIDVRTVILSLSGLFFGIIPTVIATLMMVIFRVSRGGMALGASLFTMISTSIIGIIWGMLRRGDRTDISWRELCLLGLASHAAMLAAAFAMPWETALTVLATVGPPIIIILPLETALMGVFMVNRAAETQTPIEPMETIVACKDGSKRNVLWGYIPLGDKSYSYGLDLTDYTKAQNALKRSLEEKDVLLREVHHRVKNNLNVISSLLSLQASLIQTPEEAVTAFQNSRDHIMAMALVHEELYKSDGYARVDMGVDSAIPCGLILNELITNAFRHAFPNGKSGEIRVVLEKTGDDSSVLSVGDNGVGMPKDQDSGTSLGLTLVHLLAEQLDGTIRIERGTGMKFVMEFG